MKIEDRVLGVLYALVGYIGLGIGYQWLAYGHFISEPDTYIHVGFWWVFVFIFIFKWLAMFAIAMTVVLALFCVYCWFEDSGSHRLRRWWNTRGDTDPWP